MNNWKKYYAMKAKMEKSGCWNNLDGVAGIYLWTRTDGDITYFYVGQAKDLKKRMLSYYMIQTGTQYPKRHFEMSLKAHKDWQVKIIKTTDNLEQLDEFEKCAIKEHLSKPNYITRNISGGVGEKNINDTRVRSNSKRVENISKKERERYTKLLSKLNVKFNDKEKTISIKTKKTKKNEWDKLSLKAFDKLRNILGE